MAARRMRIEGQLAEHASYRHHAGGGVVLIALLEQGAGMPPLLAERPMGVGAAASYAAAAAAKAMRKGDAVTVHAEGIKPDRFLGQPVMRLTVVSHIEHAAAPAHHEPNAALAA